MKFTVLVVILASEILGIFGIIVYDGTSRRSGVQITEPSQLSEQQVLPSSGFRSVVVHRPPRSGGGLTVKDPPKGWPLSEMHISFDSHGSDQRLSKSNEVKVSVTHVQSQRTSDLEQRFKKPAKEPRSQRHPNEIKDHLKDHRQLPQETQQQHVYHHQQEKTEVEIHPQVIIKLPEHQTARLLRPLYVEDQTFPLPSAPQEKPFHPSVQISDSTNNEATLTPFQADGFSPMINKPSSDPESKKLKNKPKKVHPAHGFSEQNLPKQNAKSVTIRHPHTTLGASYSVAPADALKSSNQLQNLMIKENVENKVPVRHGKTLHRQRTTSANDDSVAHNKNAVPVQTSTYDVSSQLLKGQFPHDGRHVPSDGFPIRLHQSPAGQYSSHFTFQEARPDPTGYQNLLAGEMLPPPARTQGRHPTSAPPRAGFTSKFVPNGFNEANNVHYISEPQRYPSLLQTYYSAYDSGSEASAANSVGQNQGVRHPPSSLQFQEYSQRVQPYSTTPGDSQPRFHAAPGSEASATTGSAANSVSQSEGARHPHSSLQFQEYSQRVPPYSTTPGDSPPRFHGQQVADAVRHSSSHSKGPTSAQGVKNVVVSVSPSQSYSISQHEPQNVFAGFKTGQFPGGFVRNIGYSLAGQGISNALHYGHAGGVGQNVPGYLNLNSGAVHVGHPAGPVLSLVQLPGSHVQSLYVPAVGGGHGVHTSSLLGVDAMSGHTQPSAEVPGTPVATPAVFSVAPLTYFRGQVVNSGNVDVGGPIYPVFPGIGGAYPQIPYNGGAGTTFVLSPAPLQQGQPLPAAIPQHASTFPANNVHTANVRLPAGDVHASSFGDKLAQQQQPTAAKAGSSQNHQA